MGQDNTKLMQKQIFDLKFTGKSLARMSRKCEKRQKQQLVKVKKAIEKGNIEGAKIYAQNAIREKNQALNYLRMQSRLDAVSSRLESAMQMGQLTKSMGGVVRGMDTALKSMNVERIAKVMDKFESQFEQLDVTTGVMTSTMDSATSSQMPEDQVNGLIQAVADEHALDVSNMLEDASGLAAPVAQQQAAPAVDQQENDLASRLAALG